MAKSMNLNAAKGLQGMLKEGHKTFEGVQGAVMRNIDASKAIAGMVIKHSPSHVSYEENSQVIH